MRNRRLAELLSKIWPSFSAERHQENINRYKAWKRSGMPDWEGQYEFFTNVLNHALSKRRFARQ